MEILRRTFAATKYPAGSQIRAALNRDTLTSEFYPSHRYMTREPARMSDGTENPAQRHHCRTFKTKRAAVASSGSTTTPEAFGRV